MSDKKLSKEFVYKLDDSIIVGSGGEGLHVNEVTLKAPTQLQMKERIILKQAVMSAIQAQSDKGTADEKEQAKAATDKIKDDDAGITGSQIMAFLFAFKSPEELNKVFDAFNTILCDGGARISNKPAEEFNISQISAGDIEGMLGEYIANFILLSVMKQAKKS